MGGRAATLAAQRRAAESASPLATASSAMPQSRQRAASAASPNITNCLARDGPTRAAIRGMLRQLMFMPSGTSGRRR